MTRKELEFELSKIGWRVHASGNGLNDYIMNHENEKTCFRVLSDRVEVNFPKSSIGAKASKYSDCAALWFMFNHCIVETDEDETAVSILAKDRNGVFISFYKF